MKIKDLIKELNFFNQDAEIDLIIDDFFGDKYDSVGIKFNPYKDGKFSSKKDAESVEIILELDSNFEINKS